MNIDDAARERQALDICGRAAELPGGAARAAYLNDACGGDVQLRRRVEALLSHDLADDFLQKPAAVLGSGDTVMSPITEQPGDRIGPYKLMEKLGEGGWGAVYVAEQEQPVRRRVALKLIKLGMDTRAVIARFEAERQALAMMDHPNIAKVLDAGNTPTGRPYFVMELVRGIRITDYCDQHNLDTGGRLELFIKVCQAIQHAHQKGIIHRDIKPSNILVTLHDGAPVPKVIDFGIAKATEGRLTDATIYTQLHQFIGTPAYMSPEQAEMSGLDIDTRSDIYSLGVLLYELLTSQTPFDPHELMSRGLDAMRRTIREQEPVRPSTRLATLQQDDLSTTAKRRATDAPKLIHLLKGDLDWIAMKCLEKDRTRRYETANALAMDIRRHLSNEPVVARPPSRGYRLQKAFRRHKLAVLAGAAVAIALVAALLVSLQQMAVAQKERKDADDARKAAQNERDAQVRLSTVAVQERHRATAAQARAEAGEENAQSALYVANMNLLQQAWERNDTETVGQLLLQTAAPPKRTNEFEWFYWQRQIRLPIRTLTGHLNRVDAVLFTPDGRKLITSGGDKTIRIWDVASGNETARLDGHKGMVWGLALSPDGRRLASGSWDHTAGIWDLTSTQLLHRLEGHRGAVVSVAWSANDLIATGSSDRTLRLWSATDGQLQDELPIGDRVEWVEFSPDGTRLVSCTGTRAPQLWDVSTRKELLRFPGAHDNFRAKFFPDGQRLVTFGPDPVARIWDISTARELGGIRGHIGSGMLGLAISPDGQRIITGSDDQSAQVWDVATGRELRTLRGHSDRVRGVNFSPDGLWAVTTSFDRTVKLWDINPDRHPLTLRGHSGPVRALACSRDGQWLLSGGEDQTAAIWARRTGTRHLELPRHPDWISSAAFSPDEERIATGSEDGITRIYNNGLPSRELVVLKGNGSAVLALAFTSDGQQLMTAHRDGTVLRQSSWSGEPPQPFLGHTGAVWSVSVSQDGQQILTGSEDGNAIVWSAASRQPLFHHGHGSPVRMVAFLPDGAQFVTASVDGQARLWRSAPGEINGPIVLRGHRRPVWAVACSPNGHRIVTGGADGTVRLWDAISGKEVLTLHDLADEVLAVAFSPDSRWIMAGGANGTIRLWEAASPAQVATWQREEEADGQRLAELRRQAELREQQAAAASAHDPGAIKEWLILGPIRLPELDTRGVGKAVASDTFQVGSADPLPRAGERVLMGSRHLAWQAAHFNDHVIDFGAFLGRGVDWDSCLLYAVTYVQSEAERPGLTLQLGWDDYAKIELNGSTLYQSEQSSWPGPDAVRIPSVSLHKGQNILLLKSANWIGPWLGALRFTTADGQPVRGLTVTLEPQTQPPGRDPE